MAGSFEHIGAGIAQLLQLRPTVVRLGMSVSSEHAGRVQMIHAHVARGVLRCRARGDSLSGDQGVLFIPRGSIHTWWTRGATGVVFLDAELNVLKLIDEARRWRLAWAPARTRYVVELRAGQVDSLGLSIGARLRVMDC